MPTWHEIQTEILEEHNKHSHLANQTLDRVRRSHLDKLAKHTGRNVIAYYSAFLTKRNVDGIDINDDDINSFMSCIAGLDRSKGLDLVLHTPGGSVAATEALAHYLRQMFGTNIRAIIPQIAMSAGTMLSLSCNSILMGKQSSLGPIDPQINGIPADVVVTEFKRAYDEIKNDPQKAAVWSPVLSRYMPSFLTQCEYAVEWSKEFVEESLVQNMFSNLPNPRENAKKVVFELSSAALNKAHNKHLHIEKLLELGVTVHRFEDDNTLQDLILSVHHCFNHTVTSTHVIKIVENHEGRTTIRNLSQPNAPQSISIGFGGPS